MLSYRLPKLSDRQILMELLQEYAENNENGVIMEQSTLVNEYELWVRRIEDYSLYGNDAWGRSLLLLCLDENRLVGILNVRYELSAVLEAMYGNIGYSVRPFERNKGYGTAMAAMGLKICREKGMKRVIIGCNITNVPSRKIICRYSGIPFGEKGRYELAKSKQYYLIVL